MSQLAEIIGAEIRKQGAISFARFMELALYCPVYGYYEAEEDKIGRRGDYYTSVSVGSLFGELLARQFLEWAAALETGGRGELEIIEAGAHDGALARDILQYLKQTMGKRFEQICYTLIEPSPLRKSWQEATLAGFKDRTRWATALRDLAADKGSSRAGAGRIIFCNELLDAMPVHRLGWDGVRKQWFEWGVNGGDGGFSWARLPSIAANLKTALDRSIDLVVQHKEGSRRELEGILPDGYTIELCPSAESWWGEAADYLQTGRLVAIDYGFGVEGLFRAERKAGTLRAYRAHHPSSDLLTNPGQQDLTADVNFAALQDVGHQRGFQTEQFTSQERFLTSIVARVGRSQRDWTPERTKQFRTLTHPDHLGSRFRVLVQSAGLTQRAPGPARS